jgi:hypothetical protein
MDLVFDILAITGSGVFFLAAAFTLFVAATCRTDAAGPLAFVSLAMAAFGAAVAGVFYGL